MNYAMQMNNYLLSQHAHEVPEWKKCYYNHNTLQNLIGIYIDSNKLMTEVNDMLDNQEPQTFQTIQSLQEINSFENLQKIEKQKSQLKLILIQTVKNIRLFSNVQMQKILFFIQFKAFGIQNKLNQLLIYQKFATMQNFNYMSIIQNTYTQIYFLKAMILLNSIKEKQTFQKIKHLNQQISNEFRIYQQRIDLHFDKFLETERKLKKLYILNFIGTSQIALQQLSYYGCAVSYQRFESRQNKTAKFLGFTIGFLFTFTAAIIFIKQIKNVTIDGNPAYQLDFPIWRGASYFIAFQWIFAFTLMFLQSKKINYRLILRFRNKQLPHCRNFLINAHIMTIIYLVLFLLFILQNAEIIQTGFRYFGHIMWLILIVYYLCPFPLSSLKFGKQNSYMVELIFFTILSPFGFVASSFPIIWLSEQAASLSQFASDFVCTAYKIKDINWSCSNLQFRANINLIILSIIFGYRLIQNSKGLGQKNWKLIPPLYYGLWRAFSALVTVWVSYFYRIYDTIPMLIIYISMAIISTSLAVYADIKGDWGLLSHKLLRKNLIFSRSKHLYYMSIILNIVLRFNWTLNISPSFVQSLNILPNYLVMIVSYLQIFRRGIWNAFRLQNQHVCQCKIFSATINDELLEQNLKKQYKDQIKIYFTNRLIYEFDQVKEGFNFQKHLLQQKIEESLKQQNKMKNFVKKKSEQLAKLKKNLNIKRLNKQLTKQINELKEKVKQSYQNITSMEQI